MTLKQIDCRMTELVKTERTTTREILELIFRAEAIKLPERLGYRDTYQWLVEKHKYSGSAAHRRIQASRLLRDMPEVAEKVEMGTVNLSTLCKMQTVLKAQHKATGCRPSVEIKREAMQQIENKTCSEAERHLHTLFPEAEISQEKTVHRRDGGELRTIQLSSEGVSLLERVRELLSHALPGATDGELLERVMKHFVERQDPLFKAERSSIRRQDAPRENAAQDKVDSASPQCGTDDRFCAASSERITPALRHKVIRRAQGQCEYIHQITRCTSRYQLEVDHIIPRAKGGSHDITNLRCLCRRHNQMMADLEFGSSFMQGKRQAGANHRQA